MPLIVKKYWSRFSEDAVTFHELKFLRSHLCKKWFTFQCPVTTVHYDHTFIAEIVLQIKETCRQASIQPAVTDLHEVRLVAGLRPTSRAESVTNGAVDI